jgi:hypothetical protein
MGPAFFLPRIVSLADDFSSGCFVVGSLLLQNKLFFFETKASSTVRGLTMRRGPIIIVT